LNPAGWAVSQFSSALEMRSETGQRSKPMQFFRHRRGDPDVAVSPDPAPAVRSPDTREAFAAGRRLGHREARLRRRRHPMLGLLVGIVAVAGAAMLALAAREGSFARGGQVVDQNLTAAAGQAQSAGADAIARTGQAIQSAGASLERKTASN
jgi:hypothetical protein